MNDAKMPASMSCRKVSALASASLDRSLTFQERFILRAHLLFCRACNEYSRQIRTIDAFLRKRLKEPDTFSEESGDRLSDVRRTRILEKMRDALRTDDPDRPHDH
jgi:predicted anti-sigma-YlaC factor YlaD